MANRTLQAKRIKLNLQIRKLPRAIEDPVGNFTEHSGTPIPARLRAEGMRAPMTPQKDILQWYKNSSKSLQMIDVEANKRCMKKYGFVHHGTPPGRKETFERMLALQRERIQKLVNSNIGFTILDTSAHWARVFRDAQETKFVILYVNFKEGVMRTSMTYNFRKNLIDDFRADKLTWVEYRNFQRR